VRAVVVRAQLAETQSHLRAAEMVASESRLASLAHRLLTAAVVEAPRKVTKVTVRLALADLVVVARAVSQVPLAREQSTRAAEAVVAVRRAMVRRLAAAAQVS
jgi:hypothetical protein